MDFPVFQSNLVHHNYTKGISPFQFMSAPYHLNKNMGMIDEVHVLCFTSND